MPVVKPLVAAPPLSPPSWYGAEDRQTAGGGGVRRSTLPRHEGATVDPALAFAWSAHGAGTRTWGTGDPVTTYRCLVAGRRGDVLGMAVLRRRGQHPLSGDTHLHIHEFRERPIESHGRARLRDPDRWQAPACSPACSSCAARGAWRAVGRAQVGAGRQRATVDTKNSRGCGERSPASAPRSGRRARCAPAPRDRVPLSSISDFANNGFSISVSVRPIAQMLPASLEGHVHGASGQVLPRRRRGALVAVSS